MFFRVHSKSVGGQLLNSYRREVRSYWTHFYGLNFFPFFCCCCCFWVIVSCCCCCRTRQSREIKWQRCTLCLCVSHFHFGQIYIGNPCRPIGKTARGGGGLVPIIFVRLIVKMSVSFLSSLLDRTEPGVKRGTGGERKKEHYIPWVVYEWRRGDDDDGDALCVLCCVHDCNPSAIRDADAPDLI